MEDDPLIQIATPLAIEAKLLDIQAAHPSLVKMAQTFARSQQPRSALLGIALHIIFVYIQRHPQAIGLHISDMVQDLLKALSPTEKIAEEILAEFYKRQDMLRVP